MKSVVKNVRLSLIVRSSSENELNRTLTQIFWFDCVRLPNFTHRIARLLFIPKMESLLAGYRQFSTLDRNSDLSCNYPDPTQISGNYGGGGGEFASRKNFFSLSNPLYEFF